MHVFTMPAENWNEEQPDKQAILHLIQKHESGREHLEKLKRYYEGKHEILNDKDRQNKLICNHANIGVQGVQTR